MMEAQSQGESGLRDVTASLGDVTALILCGGRGERLRPLTDEVPKPLLPVNGQSLLTYLLEHLRHQGIRDFVLCTGYKAEMFEEFVAQPPFASCNIRCQNSGEAGITERLAAARPLVSGRALVCYADTLADVDLAALGRVHESRKTEATLTVFPYRSPFGIVECDGLQMARRFVEKPELPYWVNIGFMLCEPAALDRLETNLNFPEFLNRLAGEGKLAVHYHRGHHWTANTEEELRDLALQLRNGAAMNL
jgi:glucose-1-phosphate cytidylyltransferase